MIAPGEPEVRGSLIVHQADLDLVAVLAVDPFRTGRSHAVEVRIGRVDVSVEQAGIQNWEARPRAEKGRLVRDRVLAARGGLGHV